MTERKFLEFLIELMDTDSNLQFETKLADVEEWDSLSYVAFLASIAKFVERRIEPEKVKSAVTVRDLYNLIN